MNKLANWVKENYTGRDVIVALQHMITMIGGTVLVPLTCGMNISITMLCAGIGTILFFFISQKKVPVFLGSSFAFLGAYTSIMGTGLAEYNAANGTAYTVSNMVNNFANAEIYDLWCRNMGKLAVALWFAGLMYVIFSFIIKAVGVEKIKKVFGPTVVGPVVMLIGFTLCQSMFTNDIVSQVGVNGATSFQVWSTAVITMATILAVNGFCKNKGFSSILKIMPIICGFVVGTVWAVIIGYPLVPKFSGSVVIFQDIFCEKSLLGFWRYITIDGNALLQVLPVALVSMMEHMGDISANSIACGKDFLVDPGVNKTIMGDGVATAFAGLLGGPSNTTYSENTAILTMTQNFKPTTVLLAAVFALILGIFVPFAEVVMAMPSPVIGGASVVLFGMISASGLRTLIENKIDLGKTKNLIVVSFTLACGLGFSAIGGIHIGDIEISPLCIATIIAILLNLIIPDYDKKEDKNTVVATGTPVNNDLPTEETIENTEE